MPNTGQARFHNKKNIFFIICDYQFAVYGTQYTRFRINNSEKKVFFGLVVAFEYHFFI